jgi:transcriptional regulator with XRE-family HTH domain
LSFSNCRIEAGLTLDDVCREFDVSQATVLAWEAGKAQPPARVARSLDVIGRMSKTKAPEGIKPRQPEFAATRDDGPLYTAKRLIKSKKRVADHGEVFTPSWLVEKMLDLVKGETERIDSRFLEPACGSGNFLVPILQRKLAAVEAKYGKSEFEKGQYALYALSCIYGVELLADNIAECRANMLGVFAKYLHLDEADELYRAASHMLSLNLIHGDAMTMKDADGGPITVVEWGYLGKGKFQRRDFRLDVLTGMAKFREEQSLFANLGQNEIFRPTESHPPMTVAELAARDVEATA